MFNDKCLMILGFDPGRDKCGVAVMNSDGEIYDHQVVSSEEALATIESLSQQYPLEVIVMGNLTTAKSWRNKLQSHFPNFAIEMIDENNSTLEARDRYWQMYPPTGITRLLPQGIRIPPRPIDDIVAIILIERYLLSNK
ncbi:MAG: pre-16S rRNA-processing nuclease YqgF [Xenococcaceae cyanobacterium MO_207.B15]|nr:pre-16S rRNA-processing nuclease YqgF [Xenococcaceae cyanobacterium MO_207.B15]